ncbi:DUF2490 domain-containing protein [Soonwooa purpurea]
MKKLLLPFVIILGIVAQAQNKENLSGFNMLSFTYKFAPKWMAYVELQTRSIEDYTYIDYYETKGGVGYSINKNNQAFIGVGRYGTYKKQKISQEEHRVWLQYTLTNRIKSLKFDHRLRAEQRFFHNAITDENTNTQRYRYRLSATLPLNNTKVQPGTIFANAFEEVFVGPQDQFFKRSRTFAGIGYQFNDNMNATSGYMFQREFASKGNATLHFLYFALNFTIDPSDDERDIHIPMAD